jgi:DeoR/GlpR family transcriptional regulator of sugar metabolism
MQVSSIVDRRQYLRSCITLTAFDRRQRLLSLMRSDPPLRVPMIAQALGVSEGTVRNDLNALAEQQQIIRVRGGGVLRNNAPPHNVPRNAAFATRPCRPSR